MPNNPPSSQQNNSTTTQSQGTVSTEPNLQKKVIKVAALRSWKKSKVTLAKDWIDNESAQKSRGLQRLAVHLCVLGENIGNEQNEERPVIIVSRNSQNATAGNVIVIPLSKQLRCRKDQNGRIIRNQAGKPIPKYDYHYFFFRSKYTFLDYDSNAKAEDITTVSKIRIGKHLGDITDAQDIRNLEKRVKTILDLR
jgi:Growth inhibitor